MIGYKSKAWRVTISYRGKNENTAKALSTVREQMMRHLPIVTRDDVSAYYNRILYPLVNEFERNLRRLLYLSVAVNARSGDYIVPIFSAANEVLSTVSEKELAKAIQNGATNPEEAALNVLHNTAITYIKQRFMGRLISLWT